MVRQARLEDVPMMVELGEIFYNAAGLSAIPYNKISTACLFREMVQSDLCTVLILERDGEVIGGIGGTLSPATYNFDCLIMLENFWFIAPHKRGEREAFRMVDMLEASAKEKGAVQLVMGAFNHMKKDILDRMYTHRGYRCTETLYTKEL